MAPFFSSTFWALTVWDIHFCIWKLSKFILTGSPLWSILVCKIPEFWMWKLWDQNFVSFDSGNIHFQKSKNLGFTFSIELRTKFVWSYSLRCPDEANKGSIFFKFSTCRFQLHDFLIKNNSFTLPTQLMDSIYSSWWTLLLFYINCYFFSTNLSSASSLRLRSSLLLIPFSNDFKQIFLTWFRSIGSYSFFFQNMANQCTLNKKFCPECSLSCLPW